MEIRVPPILSNTQKNQNSLDEIGLSAIFIFSDSGIPIYFRNFSNEAKFIPNSEDDDLLLSAFLSSLSNFITVYHEDEFRGFSSQNYRYHIKITDEKIFCLVLNSNVFKLASGQLLVRILDKTLNEFIKSFMVYYKMTKTKDFSEKSFLDNFEEQIDLQLLFHLKNSKTDGSVDHSITFNHGYEYTKDFLSETFNYAFLRNGILGIIVLNKANEPISIRDFGINQKYIRHVEFYQRIVSTLKEYNQHNVESIIDIGIGQARIVLDTGEVTICLILSEKFFWKYNERKLRFFTTELLKNLLKTIMEKPKYSYDSKNNSIHSEVKLPLNYLIDRKLHTNLLLALKQLDL